MFMCALIMCKSKDAVIASYHWAVLHTPVDTRAMYSVSSLLPLFVSRTFRYGRGEREDCEKKDCKGDRIRVFQWLARLARLARTFGSLAPTLATLVPYRIPKWKTAIKFKRKYPKQNANSRTNEKWKCKRK